MGTHLHLHVFDSLMVILQRRFIVNPFWLIQQYCYRYYALSVNSRCCCFVCGMEELNHTNEKYLRCICVQKVKYIFMNYKEIFMTCHNYFYVLILIYISIHTQYFHAQCVDFEYFLWDLRMKKSFLRKRKFKKWYRDYRWTPSELYLIT